jgi:hypothetical protein
MKTYPRYFRGTEKEHKNDIVCFPSEGSLGTVYYLDLRLWSTKANWTLSEMNIPPVDEEIVRWQAIALGVPSELPPFKPADPGAQVKCDACGEMTPDNDAGICVHCS